MALARALRRFGIIASLGGALLLAGCSGGSQFLGTDKSTPDEFAVVSRPPLTMPPDFRLRPPRQAGRVEPTQAQQARQTVFGVEPAAGARAVAPAATPGQAGGEAALLARAGANAVDANIRATVDREGAILARADDTFLDRLLAWRDPAPRGTVIDAAAEARRLQENQALGRPVTAGETPTIERKKRGLLEGLF
jgi:hypothetical protein